MSDDTRKKIWIAALILITAIYIFLITRIDYGEAAIINGQSIEINEEWTLRQGDNIYDISLPRAIRPENESPEIETIISSAYSGFTLELPVKNALVTAYLNEEVIYEEDQNSPGNLIFLPDYKDNRTLTIKLNPRDRNTSIYIEGASVTRGDTAVIRQIKGSLFKLFCCVLLLICTTVLSTLEVVRRKSKWEEENLHRLALFSLMLLLFSVADTGIPAMFFGNEVFFRAVQGITIRRTEKRFRELLTGLC